MLCEQASLLRVQVCEHAGEMNRAGGVAGGLLVLAFAVTLKRPRKHPDCVNARLVAGGLLFLAFAVTLKRPRKRPDCVNAWHSS